MTKSLAREVSNRGVRVNAVAPGPINTPLVRELSQEWRVRKAAELPLGRFGEPEEVAATVSFLASPAASLFVGQTLGPNSGDVMIGADNLTLEQTPSAHELNFFPVHTYLLAEAGVPILEMAFLEELAAERLYEFAFFGACIKLRGATGAPMRPVAMPLTCGSRRPRWSTGSRSASSPHRIRPP